MDYRGVGGKDRWLSRGTLAIISKTCGHKGLREGLPPSGVFALQHVPPKCQAATKKKKKPPKENWTLPRIIA